MLSTNLFNIRITREVLKPKINGSRRSAAWRLMPTMLFALPRLGTLRVIDSQKLTKFSNPNGIDRTTPNRDPNTILTARRLLFVRPCTH
jgi:hypothetical protein